MNRDGASPVFAYLKHPSMVDFPGHLAGVLFVSGCNLSCGFCHNAALMAAPRKTLSWHRLEEACQGFRSNWATGIVVTGGEPTLSPELPHLLKALRNFGFSIKLDTNGTLPNHIEPLLPLLDYIAMDIKASPSGYPSLTGLKDLTCIRRSVELIMQSDCDYEFRTTVIESFHTDRQMHEIGELIRGSDTYIMQPFIPKDDLPGETFRQLPRTSPDRLTALKSLMAPYAHTVTVRGEIS